VFLDLDGTLLELADVPQAVERTDRYSALIERLASLEPCAVAFVSGRTLPDIDRLLAPHRFAAAGMHGSQRRDGMGRAVAPHNDAVELDAVRNALHEFAAVHEELFVEDKTLGLALHYRRRPDLHAAIEQFATVLASRLPAAHELLRGNRVLEVRPTGIDKGGAIRAFMGEPPFAGRTPLFIGDDVTDEAGFRTVNALGGVSIKVAAGPTVARWRLPDVSAVLAWLETALRP
jgi:trehalose 6-phosphate phosphatase